MKTVIVHIDNSVYARIKSIVSEKIAMNDFRGFPDSFVMLIVMTIENGGNVVTLAREAEPAELPKGKKGKKGRSAR